MGLFRGAVKKRNLDLLRTLYKLYAIDSTFSAFLSISSWTISIESKVYGRRTYPSDFSHSTIVYLLEFSSFETQRLLAINRVIQKVRSNQEFMFLNNTLQRMAGCGVSRGRLLKCDASIDLDLH